MDISAKKPSTTVNVQTMPADFYGGVNPVIKFKRVEREIVLGGKSGLTNSEKNMLDKSTAAGTGDPLHAVNIFTNRKYTIIFWSLLFLLAISGAGVYYYLQSRGQTQRAVPNPPVIELPATSSEPVSISTTSEPVVVTDTPLNFLPEVPIDFPSYLLGDSSDLDKDSISDVAEDLFGSDPGNPDTDGDTHTDGHEVFYLYNPAGKEPIKLADSQFVKEYRSSNFGYSLLYPANWALGTVDEDGREVLFSTLTGENIELRTFDLAPQQNFLDWFAVWGKEQNTASLVDFQTRFLETGRSRNDSLVYYFNDSSHVYVLVYHTTDSNVVNYRSVIVMMARSFKSGGYIVPPDISPTPSSTFPTEMPAPTNAENTSSSGI